MKRWKSGRVALLPRPSELFVIPLSTPTFHGVSRSLFCAGNPCDIPWSVVIPSSGLRSTHETSRRILMLQSSRTVDLDSLQSVLANKVSFSNTPARVAFVATPFSARNHDCRANVRKYIGCQQLTLQNGTCARGRGIIPFLTTGGELFPPVSDRG